MGLMRAQAVAIETHPAWSPLHRAPRAGAPGETGERQAGSDLSTRLPSLSLPPPFLRREGAVPTALAPREGSPRAELACAQGALRGSTGSYQQDCAPGAGAGMFFF